MTIHLPEDLERIVYDHLRAGRYRTEDEVIRAALQRLDRDQQATPIVTPKADPVLGAMREAAEELDEIVVDAMKRRQEPRRPLPGD